VQDDQNEGDDQQDVDERRGDVESEETQGPQDHENDSDNSKHVGLQGEPNEAKRFTVELTRSKSGGSGKPGTVGESD
jgi:hypothetical protein